MEHRKLYRSQSDRVIAGVCGGLADYFALDPTLVRLIFVILLLVHGFGLLLYIVSWIVIPDEPLIRVTGSANSSTSHKSHTRASEAHSDSETVAARAPIIGDSERSHTIGGVMLIVIGALLLANNLFGPSLRDALVPLVVILIGIVLMFSSHRRKEK